MKLKNLSLWAAVLALQGLLYAQSADQDAFQACLRDAKPKFRIRVSFGVSREILLKTKPYVDENLKVHFPARNTVKLAVLVDTDGKVICALFQEGHPLLSSASLEAAKQLRYRPYIIEGKPVGVETTVVFNYSKGEFKVQ